MKNTLPSMTSLLVAGFFLAFLEIGYSHPQTVPAPAAEPTYRGVNPDTLPPMGLDDPLPLDPHVRVDTLANGLIYYVRENAEPEKRAQLRLGMNTGSILESEDQRGLAHFLEHMLFNGTKRFEAQEIVNFMERIGMEFGPDVNAYTSFDETVYQLQIPTDSTAIVERSFDVLEDWAGYATLASGEIENERGVVLEEWRQRLETASGRMMRETLPVYLYGSRYAERLPIGDTTVIKNATPEAIRRFYRDWYRPDLMAVVAVGDFEADRIERLIREHFSSLPAPDDPPARRQYGVPGHESTLYRVVTDPEFPHTQVEVSFKKDRTPDSTVSDYRQRFVESLFNRMLNQRFTEIEREASSPFASARVYRGGFTRSSEFYGLEAQVSEDSIFTGFEALMTEVYRVRRHGFTTSELRRQKDDMLRSYRSSFEERHNARSGGYASSYLSHYFEDSPIPGIAYRYALAQRYLPEITVEEVNEQALELLAGDNRAVIVRMPEDDSLQVPSEQALAGTLERVRDKSVEPYVDDVEDEPLLSIVPEPVSVTARHRIDTLDVTEITLENGVRLVMKPTDFKEDQIQMTAFSPGGTSLVSDADYFEATNAATLVNRSGVGPFTRTQLEKKLSGTKVSVRPFIGEVEEGFQGSASPEDLETMFKLIHLYVTRPRADSSALLSFQNQMKTMLKRRSVSPAAAFQDSLMVALFGRDLRRMTPTMGMVDSLDLEAAFQIYRDRFSDMSDFTFVFVGNLSVDTVETLARRYIGTLPATDREETWRDVAPDPRPGIVQKEVRKGQGDRSQTVLAFHDSLAYNRHNRYRLRSLAKVLNIRLREDLREDRGAVYSIQARSSVSGRPDPLYRVMVSYGSSPDSAEILVDAVFDHVEALKNEPVDVDYVNRVKEQQRRERETSMETNGFWTSNLKYYYSREDEPVLDVLTYDTLIDSLEPEDIQQAAREYLNTEHYAKVILYPEPTLGPRKQPNPPDPGP
jgi:zinc protease